MLKESLRRKELEMAMIRITNGGANTEVPESEVDWYIRNGWKKMDEAPAPVIEEAPAPDVDEEKPAKKSEKK